MILEDATKYGYWKRKVATGPRKQHVCSIPLVPGEVNVGSVWVCAHCQVEWTLSWVGDGSPYPLDRAAASTPHRYSSDESLWIAFGGRNKRLLKRHDVESEGKQHEGN